MATKNFVLSRNADPKNLTAQDKISLRESIGAQTILSAPIDVLNYGERTAITDGIVGTTRVIQSDQIGIIWTLIDKPESSDDSWIGQPYTQNVDGSISVTMELANVRGTVPSEAVLARNGGRPTYGDYISSGGRDLAMLDDVPPRNPPGMIRFVSTKSTAFLALVTSSTGFVAGRSFDGTIVFGTTGIDFTVPASGNWSGPSPKEYFVWPCLGAADPTLNGEITSFKSNNSEITELDWDGTPLTYLRVDAAGFKNLKTRGAASLQTLYINDSSELKSLDLSGTSVNDFQAFNSSSLERVVLSGLGVGIVILNNCPNLHTVIADGFAGGIASSAYYGFDLSNNNLTTDAVYRMLDGMLPAATTPTWIMLYGNPCDAMNGVSPALTTDVEYNQADVQALLTAKGYSLTLTDGVLAP